jgi:hypothetical protein
LLRIQAMGISDWGRDPWTMTVYLYLAFLATIEKTRHRRTSGLDFFY